MMKLETVIPPRKDGTVNADFGDVRYTFRADASGVLSCEVNDDAHIAALISTGNFYPASRADFDAAAKIIDEEPSEPAVKRGRRAVK
jgi:hypothetical protein